MQHAVCNREIGTTQRQPAILLTRRNERKTAQIGDADPHRLQLQRMGRFRASAMLGNDPVPCFVQQINPMRDEAAIARLSPFETARQRRADPAARSVAEYHDLANIELGDREFNGRRDTVARRVGFKRGYQIGNIAHDKYFAGRCIEHLCRIDPAVGA